MVSALLLTVLARSTVGEALVLHQHGRIRAHLHLLGHGDLLSNAAESSSYGHRSRPDAAIQSTFQRVRVIAVITTGAIFVSTARDTGADEAGIRSPHNSAPVSIAESHAWPPYCFPTQLCPVRLGRSASAVLLLRNHTLLL